MTDLDWQRFFADPRLKRLIDLALVNNRDLRVAVLNIEQARALYDVRRADQWPTDSSDATTAFIGRQGSPRKVPPASPARRSPVRSVVLPTFHGLMRRVRPPRTR